jgi:hypothetical protein
LLRDGRTVDAAIDLVLVVTRGNAGMTVSFALLILNNYSTTVAAVGFVNSTGNSTVLVTAVLLAAVNNDATVVCFC